MKIQSRREFISNAGAMAAAVAVGINAPARAADEKPARQPAIKMRLGLVTYNWGRSWDLPSVIKNCEETGFLGVELRSTHKHGVEIAMNNKQRAEVARRFADSPVSLAGLGSACEYHSPDKAVLQKNIDETKAFAELCHDIGGEGVKVRPNGLPKGVPVERTLEQIGRALNAVAQFSEGFGVQIRLEVHGRGTSDVPNIKRIMDVANHPNVTVCWNCNAQDLAGKGLEHNFNLVKRRIGTVHIHDLRNDNYPWKQLFALLKSADFSGWTLLEDGRVPPDIVQAMKENRRLWETLAAS